MGFVFVILFLISYSITEGTFIVTTFLTKRRKCSFSYELHRRGNVNAVLFIPHTSNMLLFNLSSYWHAQVKHVSILGVDLTLAAYTLEFDQELYLFRSGLCSAVDCSNGFCDLKNVTDFFRRHRSYRPKRMRLWLHQHYRKLWSRILLQWCRSLQLCQREYLMWRFQIYLGRYKCPRTQRIKISREKYCPGWDT